MIRHLLAILFGVIALKGFAQDVNLDGHWQTIGPLELPSPNSKSSSKGIGPVEFIRTTKSQKGLLLAGALNGGLFVSEDSGENWLNAGSDDWTYSACGWAEIHPENPNIWVASSNDKEVKSRPGSIGDFGGVFLTTDKGVTWKQIASKENLSNITNQVIYDIKFRPNNPNQLYVFTSDDIYFTKDCLADQVIWEKESRIRGMFYDAEFVNGKPYITNQRFGKWHLYRAVNNDFEAVPEIEKYSDQINYITLDSKNELLYVLVDLKKSGDLLFEYNTKSKAIKLLSKNQYVLFGSGKTFAVNPHQKNEIIVGVGLRVKSFDLTTKRFKRLGSDYHVDVEYVSFDPFDTSKVYLATHGGVYISEDGGKSWESKSKGLGVAEVLGMDVSNTYPAQVVIGTYHDGSSVYADWDGDGKYSWENVNGGDALIPLMNPNNPAEIYTSNQFSGGGIYYSKDTAKNNQNIHNANGLITSGWEMAACLHPEETNVLFFNFKRKTDGGNMDVFRTNDASKRQYGDIISDFKQTHQLERYKVYSLMNSKYHPNVLIAYVLHYDKDENGKNITRHRVFRTNNCLKTAGEVIESWHELETPRNSWIGDIVMDHKKSNKLYYSYVSGIKDTPETKGQTAMVYCAKYNKKGRLKTFKDISTNIPYSIGGRYNMELTEIDGKRVLFVATRTGVYLGAKKTMKGKVEWQKVGHGLPHCKVYGIHYNDKYKVLTVGLKGRGVWQLDLSLNVIVTK